MSISRLVRFIPRQAVTRAGQQDLQYLLGEPIDRNVDVGLAVFKGEEVEVEAYGTPSNDWQNPKSRFIKGVGYHQMYWIKPEMSMPVPEVPSVFLRPAQSLADPYPQPTIIPRAFVKDQASDYESELAVIIGEDCKNVSEEDAMGYVSGYTAANDVSSRVAQFAQSQWCYSKGFDGSCPLGPAFVPVDQVKDVTKMQISGALNGEVVQESGIDDLIFNIPQIIAFLSRGTTLPAGTIIITGTPAGVGWAKDPKKVLREGDEFRVHISHGVGTLIHRIVEEK